jgi:hypothetical protein
MKAEDAIELRLKAILDGQWRIGTVTGSSSSPARVIVSVSGGSMTIPRVNTYTSPTVGKAVLIASTPSGYIAIAEIA